MNVQPAALHHLQRIDYAGPRDCVFGRGGYTNTHEGTIAYRAFVDERFFDYRFAANNQQKEEIRDERIHTWIDQGGRFLTGNLIDGFFLVTDWERIQEKTGQRLRENQPDARAAKYFDNLFPEEPFPEEPAHYSEQNLRLMQATVGEFKPEIEL